MSQSPIFHLRSQRLLDAAAYLTLAMLVAIGLLVLADPLRRGLLVVLCVAFGLVDWRGYPSIATQRQAHCYFLVQGLICTSLIWVFQGSDVFGLLFFILALQAVLMLPLPASAGWVVLFYLITSGTALIVRGAPGLINVLFNLAVFALTFVFGNALREAELARRENQQLLDELRATQRRLRELAVAEERNRLARDLHDSVKQQVFAAGMRLGAAQAVLAPEHPAYAHVVAAEGLARQAGEELTGLIRALRPAALEHHTLAEALRTYVAGWSRQCGIAAELQVQGAHHLPPAAEQALFRVAQEALANVARHSGTARVRIDLIFDPARALLAIGDDGRGFQPGAAAGVGLASMHERMAEIRGWLQVDGERRPGTQVTAVYEYVAGEVAVETGTRTNAGERGFGASR